jgi:hypothetical protein
METQTMVDPLDQIAENLRRQDNRITQAPIFAVQEKRRVWGVEEGDGHEWRETDDWGPVDDEKAAELERRFDIFGEIPEGYARICYLDIWQFVTACFTEAGCKEFIRINGHNLTEPRIYAYGSHRNAEWRTVRDHLLARATPTESED